MARRHRQRGQRLQGFNLRDDPQLQPFVLPDVHPTGERIGGGAYGTVEELLVNGLICAGKKLHDILVEQKNQDVRHALEKFVEECTLLASVRHPNVVQFLGICFLDTSDLPVLVMEYLPYCLDSLLEGRERVELPLGMKYTILYDVILGLLYLHTRIPPVIHRDLTAKNVLLNSAMMAKLADLGVARIINQQPGRLAATMTQTPGTLSYMPPEVLEENPKYNSTIDMFSFGHLALFTLVQDFPYPTAQAVMDANGMMIGRTEVQRRSRQMEQLSRQLGGRHLLVQLVTQCLHNDPRQRPSARQVLTQLEGMRGQIEDPYENMSKLDLIQALRGREGGEGGEALQAQVTELQSQLEASQAETHQVQGQLEAIRTETRQVQDQLQAKEAELETSRTARQQIQAEVQRSQSRIQHVEDQLRSKEAEVQRSQSRTQHVEAQWRADVQQYQTRVRQAEDELRQREREIQELRAQLRRRDAGATGLTRTTHQPAQAHWRPRSFNWRRGRNLPTPIDGVYIVFLSGKFYVRGGGDDVEENYIIRVYTPESDGWSRLPQCPVRSFALAVVDRQLVVVGGEDRSYRKQSTLLVLDSTSQRWTTPYPNMITARSSPGVISYQQYLVVAGGYTTTYDPLNTVDILNSTTKQWFAASPLPIQSAHWTSAVVGDTLYLLGGYEAGNQMLSISLPALVSHATSTSQAPPPKWEETETKLSVSTAVTLHNSLLAVGGEDDNDRPSSAIHLYDPQTRQWTEVGDIPEAVQTCGCAILSSGKLVVVGGWRGLNRSKMVHIASVN